jgi:hypothetical protein
VRPVHRGRWAWAPVILVAAAVTGALTGPLASAASAAGTAQPATVQLAGTARSAVPRSATDLATNPPGTVGVRLLDVPAHSVKDPRAREYVVDALKPGTTIHRRMEVSNTTTSLQHVTVYAAAAAITRGSFAGAAAHTANELSSWTKMSRPSLDIAAGATAVDTITVAIPSTASRGERYAVVWASISNAANGGSTALVNGGRNGGSIALVNRVGIRMYLYVGGSNPATSFTVNTLTGQRSSAGHPLVRAMVHNTGGRAVDFSGTLKLSEVTGGLTGGPYQAQLGATLAPGQSEPVWFVLTGQVGNGPWNAMVTLRSGLNQESFRGPVTFAPGTRPAASPQRVGSGISVGKVLAIAALVLLLAALAALIIMAYRRRRHLSEAKNGRFP